MKVLIKIFFYLTPGKLPLLVFFRGNTWQLCRVVFNSIQLSYVTMLTFLFLLSRIRLFWSISFLVGSKISIFLSNQVSYAMSTNCFSRFENLVVTDISTVLLVRAIYCEQYSFSHAVCYLPNSYYRQIVCLLECQWLAPQHELGIFNL